MSMPIDSMAAIVRAHGAAGPDAPALEYAGRTITFGDLDRRSNQLANALAAEGVGEGDRVAFLDKNCPEFFEVAFAVSKLNAIGVGVNWRLAPAEIAQVLADADPKIVIVGDEYHTTFAAVEPHLAPRPIIAIGGHDRWPAYETVLGEQPALDPGRVPTAADVAIQMYTSGTTGTPKGVMLTNENLFRGIDAVSERWRVDATSVNLVTMPMFHVSGSAWAMIGLYHGCRTVLLREVDPDLILEVIPKFGVTNGILVPAVIQYLLAVPGIDDVDFSTLRSVLYGASPITDAVLTRALEVFGCEFVQAYGLTETTGAITELSGADHDPSRPHLLRSAGRPFPWVEMRIVDPETAADVPQGSVGEIWTRSHQNMKGYFGNPEATAATITADGWLRTGDAGYFDADGYLFLHDRVKDMIVSGGENVYPAEVENVLAGHPDVADVAVIGVPDDRWGEAVKALVVRRAGTEVSEADLIAFARERLAGYKLPKSVDFTDALPRNPSGKLLKREIRAPYWRDRARQIG